MVSENILLIEDEGDIADMVTFALQRAGMRCRCAQTGGEGLAMLDATVDLLILDVGLPDQDGFEVLKTLRQRGNTPVIMLTAHQDEVDRVLGLELGADDYMGKPFSPRELVARVKAVLRRAQAGIDGSTARATGFSDDRLKQRICYRAQALPLTHTELLIMRVLLTHPQRVFSRQQLLDQAFAPNHPSDVRTIDTHIKALRMKLRAAGAPEVIHTVRSLGYSFREDASCGAGE